MNCKVLHCRAWVPVVLVSLCGWASTNRLCSIGLNRVHTQLDSGDSSGFRYPRNIYVHLSAFSRIRWAAIVQRSISVQTTHALFDEPNWESGFESHEVARNSNILDELWGGPFDVQRPKKSKGRCFPDMGPCAAVMSQMMSIRSKIFGYRKSTGHHPKEISEIDLGSSSNRVSEMVDPWGQLFVYIWLPSGYLLYSKGEDQRDGTSDDLASTDVSPCFRTPYSQMIPRADDSYPVARPPRRSTIRTRPGGCVGAWHDIEELRSGLERIHEMSGRYPVALSDLDTAGVWTDPVLEDPWGREYVYRRIDAGFELYSTGDDQRTGTEDDLVAGFDKGRCKQSPYLEEIKQDKSDNQLSPSAKCGGCGCSFVGR
jgi:hypothetical protein